MFRASSLNSFFWGEACSFSILNDKGWEVGGHSDCHRVMSQEWRLVMRTMHQLTITSGRGFEQLEASIVSQWTISKCFEQWGWPPNQPQLALTMILTWQDLELDNCDHYIHFNLFVGQEFVLAIKLQVALRLSFLVQCLTSLETDSHTLQTPKMLVTQHTWRLADWVFYCVSPCIVSICHILWLTLWN